MTQCFFFALRRGLMGSILCGTALFLATLPALALPSEAIQLRDEACLQAAYPNAVAGLLREGDVIWLMLHNGQRVMYAHNRPEIRDADGALVDATVSQSLAIPYPSGKSTRVYPTADPGRDRSTAFMRALYGDNPAQLRLETISVGNSRLRFAVQHGAAEALRRVVLSLESLARNPALKTIIFPLGGGQYWRTIAGTERLSAHSFGIAVDLNPKKGGYWRWKSIRPAAYPQAIVDVFEAQGFIWGGRWKHFDAMHFEYRPELLCPQPRP